MENDEPLTRAEADPSVADPDNPMNMPPNPVITEPPRCPTCGQFLPNGMELEEEEEQEPEA